MNAKPRRKTRPPTTRNLWHATRPLLSTRTILSCCVLLLTWRWAKRRKVWCKGRLSTVLTLRGSGLRPIGDWEAIPVLHSRSRVRSLVTLPRRKQKRRTERCRGSNWTLRRDHYRYSFLTFTPSLKRQIVRYSCPRWVKIKKKEIWFYSVSMSRLNTLRKSPNKFKDLLLLP